MLRQVVSTSSRALRSAPRVAANLPALRTPVQNTPAAWSLRRTVQAQPAVARWYSDAKEAPAEGNKAEKADESEAKEAKETKDTQEGADESDALAELKKNLETKEAEVRDWKVCSFVLHHGNL